MTRARQALSGKLFRFGSVVPRSSPYPELVCVGIIHERIGPHMPLDECKKPVACCFLQAERFLERASFDRERLVHVQPHEGVRNSSRHRAVSPGEVILELVVQSFKKLPSKPRRARRRATPLFNSLGALFPVAAATSSMKFHCDPTCMRPFNKKVKLPSLLAKWGPLP